MRLVKLPKKGFCKTYVCNLREGQIFQLRDSKTSPSWMFVGWNDSYNSYTAVRLCDGHLKEMSAYSTVVLVLKPFI